ncbi:UNC93-like protein MFSD11 isoform X2 [Branchiostoma floridae]|uniref:UNC93-like protein MFSD11 n=1 Tax=Branchiostoma floridae TaxID=7739 RepID=A0A9J7M5A6_BRAFL|nr:UNC93-like protein MFSD11 isoform X2 [Branchiostoma floridae]
MTVNMADMRTFNVVVLGFSFMFIFTAFQTGGMIEQTVIQSVLKEGNFQGGSGYVSLAIIYSVFALANWGAPSVVSVFGPRCSMVIGAVMYCLFIAVFIYPMVWALYLGSVLIGLGAAVIWTAQGSFLTTNSTQETIGRNSGIFWALLQCSLLFGNIFVWQEFSGKETIDSKTRIQVYVVLLVVCCVGTLMLFVLRNRRPEDRSDLLNVNSGDQAGEGPLQAFKRSIQLLKTKEMLLLGVCFAYTGFELTFFSGVYGTCIGNTRAFGEEAKSLIGISGAFIGAGEILGGAAFGLGGKLTNRHGRDPIILFGFIVHMTAFYLIYINLPQSSPISEIVTDASYYPVLIHSNKYVAILCSFLLGLGDSSFNTQVYSILGFMFPEDSAPAFALFKFVQSLTAAAGFFYSKYLLLQWQLLILVVFGVAGTLAFFEVEWKTASASRKGYTQIG